MFVKKHTEAALPAEYIGSAVFSHGVYFVTRTELVRYVHLADEETRHSVESVLKKHGKLYCAETDEGGEHLLLGFRSMQVVYSRAEKEFKEMEMPVGAAYYLERNRIFSLTPASIAVYEAHTQHKLKLLKIKETERLGQVNKLVYTEQRILLAGSKLMETTHENLFSEGIPKVYTLFQLEDQMQKLTIVQTLRVKRPVLICPEPITFIAEKIQREVFTEWGLVVVYRTGVEVYRSKKGNYRLEYIYRSTPELVEGRRTLFPERQVFIKDGTKIVELTSSGPFYVGDVEESAKVFQGASFLLVLSLTNYTLSLLPGPQPVPAAEKDVHPGDTAVKQGLSDAAERVHLAIEKYKEIDYSILEGKTEREQTLLLEKILNSFKETVTNNLLILSLSLQERAAYLCEASKDLASMECALHRQTKELAEGNSSLLSRLSSTAEYLKRIHVHLSAQEKDSPEVQRVRERIKGMEEKIKQKERAHLQSPEQKQTVSLLKHHKSFLQKHITILENALR
ncbi:hypothetical protein NECID01_1830 [Nematocida sp. AWRm77]|nr:hypothetical protein NECID01_1830 [Nematocida sp. AWRm77]